MTTNPHPAGTSPAATANAAVLQLQQLHYTHPRAAQLIAELDAELDQRYRSGDAANAENAQEGADEHANITKIRPQQFAPPSGVFLVASVCGKDIGCVAMRQGVDELPGFPPNSVELKRMYVRPAHRRQGYARQLFAAILRYARAQNYAQLYLITGMKQPEAMALYESMGMRPIPSFGGYQQYEDARAWAIALNS